MTTWVSTNMPPPPWKVEYSTFVPSGLTCHDKNSRLGLAHWRIRVDAVWNSKWEVALSKKGYVAVYLTSVSETELGMIVDYLATRPDPVRPTQWLNESAAEDDDDYEEPEWLPKSFHGTVWVSSDEATLLEAFVNDIPRRTRLFALKRTEDKRVRDILRRNNCAMVQHGEDLYVSMDEQKADDLAMLAMLISM